MTAPNTIVLTAPSCSGDDCGTAMKSAALNLTWTGGASSGVQAQLVSAIPSGGGHSVVATCNFTSSPATIPAAVMGALGADSDGYRSRLTVQPINVNNFSAGAYQVSITALGDVTTGYLTVSN